MHKCECLGKYLSTSSISQFNCHLFSQTVTSFNECGIFFLNIRPDIFYLLDYVVLGKSCSQAKHTATHVLPGQKMQMASFAQAKDATASFA